MKILTASLAICLMSFAPQILPAQDTPASTDTPKTVSALCDEKSISAAEAAFQKRFRSGEALGAAEKRLATLLKLCSDFPTRSKTEEQLSIVREERAEQLFRIAVFYLKKFQAGTIKSPVGGCARLTELVEKFPDYSQIDKARSLLKTSDCLNHFTEPSRKRSFF
jgi:hypothetical protein